MDETTSFIDLNAESMTIDDDDPVSMPTPSIARRSTMVAMASVDILQGERRGAKAAELVLTPAKLAEIVLRERAIAKAASRNSKPRCQARSRRVIWTSAASLAEEVARLIEPEAVRSPSKACRVRVSHQ